MARSEKIVCDKCGEEEEEFKGHYPEGWGLLSVVGPSGKNAAYELCRKCTREASPKS